MKLINSPVFSFTVEMTLEEFTGIYKMIGYTNFSFRQENYRLTVEQSKALSDAYVNMTKILRDSGVDDYNV